MTNLTITNSKLFNVITEKCCIVYFFSLICSKFINLPMFELKTPEYNFLKSL